MGESTFLAIGLMSGTSADGIDAALIETDGIGVQNLGPTFYTRYPEHIKCKILQAYGRPVQPETYSLTRDITYLHKEIVLQLLKKADLRSADINLIGFHGQTLFHKPPLVKGEKGETYNLGDGKLLASLTGIPVVDQFRVNDLLHGGQGAPFVPLFHQALSINLPKPLCIINIGGIANITWMGHTPGELLAFDMGPGNALMDDWVRKHTQQLWDQDGKIALQGKVNENLLARWLSHPYFSQTPPKALDRETFKFFLNDLDDKCFEDGVATLTAFTAASFKAAFIHLPYPPKYGLIAGGGAHNPVLIEMIKSQLKIPIKNVSDHGWNIDAFEAQAFGFLAVRSLKNLPLSLPSTTGVPYPLSGGRLCKPGF